MGRKRSRVRLCYQSYYVTVGDLFLNFKKVVRKNQILGLSQHTSIEFQTLRDIKLIYKIVPEKFDV